MFGVKCIVEEEGEKKLEDKEKMKNGQRKKQKVKRGKKVEQTAAAFKRKMLPFWNPCRMIKEIILG